MNRDDNAPGQRLGFAAAAIGCLLIGLAGGWYFQSQSGAPNKAAVEKIVHDYILEHPEILPQAMQNLEQRESGKALAGVRGQVEAPFPGAVLGNPNGKVTLVEFSDYGCTYCRQSVENVKTLVAENADLRVVVRELPILSPQSAEAAKWGLAAAEQGKYDAFHNALFAAGRPDPATIEAVATQVGLDMARARQVMADPRIEAELRRNIELAQKLGFKGTPSWVVGDTVLQGAIPKEDLNRVIAEARKAA